MLHYYFVASLINLFVLGQTVEISIPTTTPPTNFIQKWMTSPQSCTFRKSCYTVLVMSPVCKTGKLVTKGEYYELSLSVLDCTNRLEKESDITWEYKKSWTVPLYIQRCRNKHKCRFKKDHFHTKVHFIQVSIWIPRAQDKLRLVFEIYPERKREKFLNKTRKIVARKGVEDSIVGHVIRFKDLIHELPVKKREISERSNHDWGKRLKRHLNPYRVTSGTRNNNFYGKKTINRKNALPDMVILLHFSKKKYGRYGNRKNRISKLKQRNWKTSRNQLTRSNISPGHRNQILNAHYQFTSSRNKNRSKLVINTLSQAKKIPNLKQNLPPFLVRNISAGQTMTTAKRKKGYDSKNKYKNRKTGYFQKDRNQILPAHNKLSSFRNKNQTKMIISNTSSQAKIKPNLKQNGPPSLLRNISAGQTTNIAKRKKGYNSRKKYENRKRGYFLKKDRNQILPAHHKLSPPRNKNLTKMIISHTLSQAKINPNLGQNGPPYLVVNMTALGVMSSREKANNGSLRHIQKRSARNDKQLRNAQYQILKKRLDEKRKKGYSDRQNNRSSNKNNGIRKQKYPQNDWNRMNQDRTSEVKKPTVSKNGSLNISVSKMTNPPKLAIEVNATVNNTSKVQLNGSMSSKQYILVLLRKDLLKLLKAFNLSDSQKRELEMETFKRADMIARSGQGHYDIHKHTGLAFADIMGKFYNMTYNATRKAIKKELGNVQRHVAMFESWGPWTKWNVCPKSCRGPTFKMRERKCLKEECFGKSIEFSPCPLDCQEYKRWTHWSVWSKCSQSCGTGISVRERKCKMTYGCKGQSSQIIPCTVAVCSTTTTSSVTVSTLWGAWSKCSVNCGIGQRFRQKYCPIKEREHCNGPVKQETRKCVKFLCGKEKQHRVQILEGADAVLPCGVKEKKTKVHWFTPKGKPIGNHSLIKRFLLVDDKLLIRETQRHDRGVYHCVTDTKKMVEVRMDVLWCGEDLCQNGGTCIQKQPRLHKKHKRYACICTDGYKGMFCEKGKSLSTTSVLVISLSCVVVVVLVLFIACTWVVHRIKAKKLKSTNNKGDKIALKDSDNKSSGKHNQSVISNDDSFVEIKEDDFKDFKKQNSFNMYKHGTETIDSGNGSKTDKKFRSEMKVPSFSIEFQEQQVQPSCDQFENYPDTDLYYLDGCQDYEICVPTKNDVESGNVYNTVKEEEHFYENFIQNGGQNMATNDKNFGVIEDINMQRKSGPSLTKEARRKSMIRTENYNDTNASSQLTKSNELKNFLEKRNSSKLRHSNSYSKSKKRDRTSQKQKKENEMIQDDDKHMIVGMSQQGNVEHDYENNVELIHRKTFPKHTEDDYIYVSPNRPKIIKNNNGSFRQTPQRTFNTRASLREDNTVETINNSQSDNVSSSDVATTDNTDVPDVHKLTVLQEESDGQSNESRIYENLVPRDSVEKKFDFSYNSSNTNSAIRNRQGERNTTEDIDDVFQCVVQPADPSDLQDANINSIPLRQTSQNQGNLNTYLIPGQKIITTREQFGGNKVKGKTSRNGTSNVCEKLSEQEHSVNQNIRTGPVNHQRTLATEQDGQSDCKKQKTERERNYEAVHPGESSHGRIHSDSVQNYQQMSQQSLALQGRQSYRNVSDKQNYLQVFDQNHNNFIRKLMFDKKETYMMGSSPTRSDQKKDKTQTTAGVYQQDPDQRFLVETETDAFDNDSYGETEVLYDLNNETEVIINEPYTKTEVKSYDLHSDNGSSDMSVKSSDCHLNKRSFKNVTSTPIKSDGELEETAIDDDISFLHKKQKFTQEIFSQKDLDRSFQTFQCMISEEESSHCLETVSPVVGDEDYSRESRQVVNRRTSNRQDWRNKSQEFSTNGGLGKRSNQGVVIDADDDTIVYNSDQSPGPHTPVTRSEMYSETYYSPGK